MMIVMDEQAQDIAATTASDMSPHAPDAEQAGTTTVRDSVPQGGATRDSAGQRGTMSPHGNDDDLYSLTVKEAQARMRDLGVSRDEKSIQRYCAKGALACHLDEDTNQYYITPASVVVYAEYLKEVRLKRRQRPATGDRMSEDVVGGVLLLEGREGTGDTPPTVMQQPENTQHVAFLQNEIERLHDEIGKMREDKDTHISDLRKELNIKQGTVDKLLENSRDDRSFFAKIMDRFTVIGSDTEKLRTIAGTSMDNSRSEDATR